MKLTVARLLSRPFDYQSTFLVHLFVIFRVRQTSEINSRWTYISGESRPSNGYRILVVRLDGETLTLIKRPALTIISRRLERERERGIVLRRRLDLDAWLPNMKAYRALSPSFSLSHYIQPSRTLSSFAFVALRYLLRFRAWIYTWNWTSPMNIIIMFSLSL